MKVKKNMNILIINKFYGKDNDKSIDENIQDINKIFYKMKK